MNFFKVLPLFSYWVANLVDDELAESIVETALRSRKEAPKALSDPLEEYIKKQVKVGQYRIGYATNAPFTDLHPEMVKRFRNNPQAAQTLLQVWAWARTDLRQTLIEILEKEDVVIWNATKPMTRLRGVWSENDLSLLCAGVSEENQASGRVMACLLAGSLPLPNESKWIAKITNPNTSAYLDDWFRALEKMDACDPVWTHLEVTLEELCQRARGVAARKEQELEKMARQKAVVEVIQLLQSESVSLEYFGLTSSDYRAELCPADQSEYLIDTIQRLLTSVQQYQDLRSARILAKNLAEEDALDQQMRTLRTGIMEDGSILAQILTSDVPQSSPTPIPPSNQGPIPEDPPSETVLMPNPVPQVDQVSASVPETVAIEPGTPPIGAEDELAESDNPHSAESLPEKPVQPDLQGSEQQPSQESLEEMQQAEPPFAEIRATQTEKEMSKELTAGEAPAAQVENQNPVEQVIKPTVQGDLSLDEPMILSPKEEPVENQPISILAGPMSLPTVEEAVALALATEEERVRGGDLPAAFWVSRAMEQLNHPGCMPAWLLAATQGAFWYASFWPSQPVVWLTAIHEFVQPASRAWDSKYAHEMAAVGALFSLLDPNQGWNEWIREPLANRPESSRVLAAVRDFARYNIPLDPRVLNMGKEIGELEEIICRSAEESRDWLRNARNHSSRTPGATTTWANLISSNGALYQFLLPVTRDDRKLVQRVAEAIPNWKSYNTLNSLIQQVNRISAIEKGFVPTTIVGKARDQLIYWAQDAAEIAEQWVDAVNQWNRKPETSWNEERMRAFQHEMGELLASAGSEFSTEPISERVEIGDFFLDKSFRLLQSILASTPDGQALLLANRPPLYSSVERQHGLTRNLLMSNLTQRLIVYPEIPWRDDLTLAQDDVAACLPFLAGDPHRSLDAALDRCAEKNDYRLAHLLLLRLSNSPELIEKTQENYHKSCRRVELLIDQTVTSYEQSLIEGVIREKEHTEYKNSVESIRRQLKQSRESKDIKEMLNLTGLERRLIEIQEMCATRRKERLEHSRTRWEEVKDRLSEITVGDEELEARVRSVIERSFNEVNIRVVEECLDHLQRALKTPPLDEKVFAERNTQGPLFDFQKKLPGLNELLQKVRLPSVVDSLRSGDPPYSELSVANLTRRRREEAASALNAWVTLKNWNEGARKSADLFPYLVSVLKYLGFEPAASSAVSALSDENNGNSSAFQSWNVMMRPETLAPVRQFGSERQDKYQVVGVWDRQGFDLISAMIEKQIGKDRPAVVLYFARLSLAQRDRLLLTARSNHLPVIVVDDVLSFYLGRERQFRLPTLFDCALPYASLNPYLENTMGVVPLELFKGREDELRRLRDPNGPAIVYGGRQLGKSALLHRMEEEFHKTGLDRYAIYEDIRTIGDPTTNQDYKRAIRDRLWSALINWDLLEKKYSSATFEKIIDVLMMRFKSDSDISILLLLDEADNFLDADAKANFYVVSQLKRLRDSSLGRFRLILAGLHNVLRFQQSNQPLAHLGSILVGPLNPNDALELLEQPLRAVGYHFGNDPTVPLHILSYTNYHPGLIQVFAHRLVEYMGKKRFSRLQPPFVITRADVEAVYLDREVRDQIKNRFVWTLQLDRRYEAIAYSMIYQQWEEQNGFDHLYTPSELYSLTRENWPQAFDDILLEEFSGYLEEMCGLGVLSEAGQHGRKYRLRSPNLVHLLGSRDDILNALADLSKRTPPGRRNLQSLHYQIDRGIYSPLTFDQEQMLTGAKSGVTLIFGSTAAGLLSLTDALSTLTKNNNGKYNEIRSAAKTLGMDRYLMRFVKENQTIAYRLAYRELEGESPQELLSQVEAAAAVCQQVTYGTLRVIFSLSPDVSWLWHQLPVKDRERAEQEKVDTIISLRRLDNLGIRQRLEHYSEKMVPTETQIDQVLAVTGGWPVLVDHLLKEIKRGDDGPIPAIERIKEISFSPGGSLRDEFWRQLSIFNTVPLKTLQALKSEGQVMEAFSSFKEEEALDYLLAGTGVSSLEGKNAIIYLARLAALTNGNHPIIESVLGRVLHDREHSQ